MKRFKQILFIASALLGGILFTACSDDNDTPVFPEKEEVNILRGLFAALEKAAVASKCK